MKKFYLLSALLSSALALSAQTFVPTTVTKKNVVLEEYTGIACVHCPDGHAIANRLAANNPGKVFPINVHTGDFAMTSIASQDFRTAVGNTTANTMQISGYPTGTVNRDKISGDATYAIGRNLWTNRTNTHLNTDAIVNIAARCTININTRVMNLHIETYYTGNSTGTIDKLNAFILQDNIEGPQTGSEANPSQVLPNGNYLHHHMLRASITGNWGDDLSPITTGSFKTSSYNLTIPNKYGAIDAILTDLSVVTFITDSTHKVLNATKPEIVFVSNEAVAFDISNAMVGSTNNVCEGNSSAKVKLLNIGSNVINSVSGYYTTNGIIMPFDHTFANPIITGRNAEFEIDNIILYQPATNNITITIDKINGNNVTPKTSTIELLNAKSIASDATQVSINIKFDKYPRENRLVVKNETDNTTILSQAFTQADSITTRTFTANLVNGKCYSVLLEDAFGDGICCGYGNGNMSVNVGNEVVQAPTGNFTSQLSSYFNYQQIVSVDKANLAQNISLFPNPTQGLVNIKMEISKAQSLQVEIINTLGQLVQNTQTIEAFEGENNIQLQVQNLANGMYFVRLSSQEGQEVLPFTLNK